MGKVITLLLASAFFIHTSFAQQNISDSTLQEIIVEAFTAHRPLYDVPASIGYLSELELSRFSNTSILPAVNTIPGVRMEERSPGSYRFSIRGSLLRSPFGVRNIKVYWSDLPLTDGGGNTYLNLLDFNSIGNIEVIKGPAGSLYGAGTGGVVLLKPPVVKQDNVSFSVLAGSLGLQRYNLAGNIKSDKLNVRLQYARQLSDGYREQTAMRRDALNADLTFSLGKSSTLTAIILYTDIFYETPGGLTLAQYQSDPKQARPAGGPNRGAVEQQAAVFNRTPYVGLKYDFEWNDRWSSRVGVFGSRTDFENPAIRNFEKRVEHNSGARTETQYQLGKDFNKGKITFGAEAQRFTSPVQVFGNRAGVRDTLQTDDDLSATMSSGFAQAEFQLPANFSLTAGTSINLFQYGFNRSYPEPKQEHNKSFEPIFSPRIALLKKLSEKFSLFASVSRGFSPPSLAEVRPSANVFNNELNAETGTSFELGSRGETISRKFFYDLTFYRFLLNQTIVPRHLDDGAEYFINAGKTEQRGIEALISWTPVVKSSGFVSHFRIFNSYAFNHYRFVAYQSDTEDFSGNKLTGIPPTVNMTGFDVEFRTNYYLNITINYVDHIPLNDANTAYANEYWLAGARLGYRKNMKAHLLEIFGGIDNIFDRSYSLGNDLNAIGGRYYNAAAGRNFFVGVRFDFAFR